MNKIEIAYNLAKIAIDRGLVEFSMSSSVEDCGAELALLFNSIYERLPKEDD